MLNGDFYRRPIEMKLIFKEDPKAWRKSTLLTALGLAILSSLLRLATAPGGEFLVCAARGAGLSWRFCAVLQPRWFRGW